jgi:tetratricopeptide (TPR) repeat protein
MMKLKGSLLVSTFSYTLAGAVLSCGIVFAASKTSKQAGRMKAPPQRFQGVVAAQPQSSGEDMELKRALILANQKNYEMASQILFNLSRNPRYMEQRPRIKYVLGLMLFEMKLYQVAAFQFVDVIRDGRSTYVKPALQKLSIVADALSDDTLLNYAIGKLNIDDFPSENQDMLRYRIGEFLMRKDKFLEAAASLQRVSSSSPNFPKAKYLEALAYSKSNRLPEALRAFTALAENRKESGITDIDRVAAVMGMARVAYQMQKWDLAIDLYRQIPRDTQLWHEALFESSWAHMRAAHFRSVLSLLHSLHSPYYDDFYLPESILLRGLVYLYICKYDEMEKTLEHFEKIYRHNRASAKSEAG